MTTLGFRSTEDLPTTLLAITEAVIGLGIIALLISFLPTVYSHFSQREVAVSKLRTLSSSVTAATTPRPSC